MQGWGYHGWLQLGPGGVVYSQTAVGHGGGDSSQEPTTLSTMSPPTLGVWVVLATSLTQGVGSAWPKSKSSSYPAPLLLPTPSPDYRRQ